jgi:FAD/FMN-containing dehydrogenase
VLRAEQVADVIAGVNFAHDNGLDLSIRDGGHSAPGFGTNDGGLVIDMSPMRTIRVDPQARTARADAGATWGDFNHATHAFGLATTGGIISTTGITGLTLGGGIGYLARGFGRSVDNLISADVVTAEGRFVTASADENEDLFWGLRRRRQFRRGDLAGVPAPRSRPGVRRAYLLQLGGRRRAAGHVR